VLNGRGEVRPEVRERVERVIRETCFSPLASARSLVSHRSQLIGLAVPLETLSVFRSPFFVELLASIGRASHRHDLSTALFLFDDEAEQELLIERVVGPRRVDGLVVAAYHQHDVLLSLLEQVEFPVVTFGEPTVQGRFGSVVVDNYLGGRHVAEHLLELGLRRIAMIRGPRDAMSADDRARGFLETLHDAGVVVDPEWIKVGDYGLEAGERLGAELLVARPEVVFAASDMMAFGVLKAAERLGLSVPHDVAVVGFDDIPDAARSAPGLTTVRQPVDLVADAVMELLQDQFRDPSAISHLVFEPSLVVRGSTQTTATRKDHA
jgi:LacI family transcriptional regulator